MLLADAIRSRRSVRQFTDRPVRREEIEQIIEAATFAPNHRLTQPWRFYVMGPEARRAYGAVLGARKAKKIEDPAAAQAMIDKVAAAGAALPAQIAVAMVLAESAETREEDYAATMMAIQNLSLTAHALGLGSHIKTGAIMEDPRARGPGCARGRAHRCADRPRRAGGRTRADQPALGRRGDKLASLTGAHGRGTPAGPRRATCRWPSSTRLWNEEARTGRSGRHVRRPRTR